MENTQEYQFEKREKGPNNSLPYWIYQALTNSEKHEVPHFENKTDATELALQIARWNLQTAQELIQQGYWTPTPENIKHLERLNKKYTHPCL